MLFEGLLEPTVQYLDRIKAGQIDTLHVQRGEKINTRSTERVTATTCVHLDDLTDLVPSSKKMFFRTNQKLLRPIHSLLKAPFDFSASASIAGPLRQHLEHREDFDNLIALGQLYDRARILAQSTLVQIRPLLEQSLSAIIPADADLAGVCRTQFIGKVSRLPGMDSAAFLSHVSVQCQLERLYDMLGLQRMGVGSVLQRVEVTESIRFLMLNEALALCLAGIAKVTHHGDQFDISIYDQVAHDALRATWFARTADIGSHSGTIAMSKALSDKGGKSVHDLAPLIVRILDQDLSIPWNRLTPEGRALKSVQQIYDAVAIVAVVFTASLRNASVKMTRADLMRYGLDFSAVSGLLHRQAQALVTDQFFTRQDDNLLVRIEGVSKGLRNHYHALEKEFGERDKLRELIGGRFFEKTNIRQRIEHGDDYKPRYLTHEGFTQYEVLDENATNEADVEFIIQDVEQGHYYFIQVKHALLGEKAFFNSIIEAIQNDIGGGVHQLREAKRLLETGLLYKTLAARGIQDARPENCSFVLLHNNAQLDYQSTDDDISLYDWTTFRNLLKDAESFFGTSNGEGKYIRLFRPLVVDHPIKVIQRLFAEHPAYQGMSMNGWASERAITAYVVAGRTIRVNGLGI